MRYDADKVLRIKDLMENLGTNKSQFSNLIGINRSVISRIFSGESPVSEALLNKIAVKVENINTNWLYSGNGPMFIDKGITVDAHDSSQVVADIIRTEGISIDKLTDMPGCADIKDVLDGKRNFNLREICSICDTFSELRVSWVSYREGNMYHRTTDKAILKKEIEVKDETIRILKDLLAQR